MCKLLVRLPFSLPMLRKFEYPTHPYFLLPDDVKNVEGKKFDLFLLLLLRKRRFAFQRLFLSTKSVSCFFAKTVFYLIFVREKTKLRNRDDMFLFKLENTTRSKQYFGYAF